MSEAFHTTQQWMIFAVFFEHCGSITEIDCLKFPETGKFNGIAMISFRTEAASKRALALDGSDMGGLSLKVQPYKATRDKKSFRLCPCNVGRLQQDLCRKSVMGYDRR